MMDMKTIVTEKVPSSSGVKSRAKTIVEMIIKAKLKYLSIR